MTRDVPRGHAAALAAIAFAVQACGTGAVNPPAITDATAPDHSAGEDRGEPTPEAGARDSIVVADEHADSGSDGGARVDAEIRNASDVAARDAAEPRDGGPPDRTDAQSTDAAAGSACGARGPGVAVSNTATMMSTGFTNGQLAPFRVCTTQAPNSAAAASLNGVASAKFYWTQTGYGGTRNERGAEACSDLAFYKEGWYSFEFYLPSPGFPVDKAQGIAQIFSLGGCSSWASMLLVRNNDLWIEHRGNCASPPEFDVRVSTNIRRNAWNQVILHFVASHASTGAIEVWYGDDVCRPNSPTYRKTGINLGFGTWNSDDTLATDASNEIGLKFGMYNFDDANYTTDETRTIYYDNVTQLVGNPANAFAAVSPTR